MTHWILRQGSQLTAGKVAFGLSLGYLLMACGNERSRDNPLDVVDAGGFDGSPGYVADDRREDPCLPFDGDSGSYAVRTTCDARPECVFLYTAICEPNVIEGATVLLVDGCYVRAGCSSDADCPRGNRCGNYRVQATGRDGGGGGGGGCPYPTYVEQRCIRESFNGGAR